MADPTDDTPEAAALSDAEVETLLPLLNKVRLQLTRGRDRG